MFGQGFDELVDFAFGVVDVGAGAEAAAADGDDDAMLGLKVMLDRFGRVHVGEEGHDAAGLTRHPRADHAVSLVAKPLRQSIGQLQQPVRGVFNPDLLE